MYYLQPCHIVTIRPIV